MLKKNKKKKQDNKRKTKIAFNCVYSYTCYKTVATLSKTRKLFQYGLFLKHGTQYLKYLACND